MTSPSVSERTGSPEEPEKHATFAAQDTAAADALTKDADGDRHAPEETSLDDVEAKPGQPDESQYERSTGKMAVIMLAIGVSIVHLIFRVPADRT